MSSPIFFVSVYADEAPRRYFAHLRLFFFVCLQPIRSYLHGWNNGSQGFTSASIIHTLSAHTHTPHPPSPLYLARNITTQVILGIATSSRHRWKTLRTAFSRLYLTIALVGESSGYRLGNCLVFTSSSLSVSPRLEGKMGQLLKDSLTTPFTTFADTPRITGGWYVARKKK